MWTLHPQGSGPNSSPPRCGQSMQTRFQRQRMERGSILSHTGQVRWGNSARTTSTEMHCETASDVISCVTKMTLLLWGLPPKISCSSLILRKTSDKSQLRDLLQNSWPVLLKTIKVTQNRESWRNCPSQEDPGRPKNWKQWRILNRILGQDEGTGENKGSTIFS